MLSVVRDAQVAVARNVKLPSGYSVSWSGQFEYFERASERLKVVVPFALLITFVLLYLTFRRADEALLIMVAVPFSLIGGMWLMWVLGLRLLDRVGRRFHRPGGCCRGIRRRHGAVSEARAGAADAWRTRRMAAVLVRAAIMEGAVLRVRPKAMTVAVILAGLAPIMLSSGTGSEMMQRIAAPMVGGMITAPILSMFVIPAAYLLLRRPTRRTSEGRAPTVSADPNVPAVSPLS